jgi:hypothetical protein
MESRAATKAPLRADPPSPLRYDVDLEGVAI